MKELTLRPLGPGVPGLPFKPAGPLKEAEEDQTNVICDYLFGPKTVPQLVLKQALKLFIVLKIQCHIFDSAHYKTTAAALLWLTYERIL